MTPAAARGDDVLAAARRWAYGAGCPGLTHTPPPVPPAGEVLLRVQETLDAFHAHVYGPDGSGGGAADVLLSEAKALAAQLQVGVLWRVYRALKPDCRQLAPWY